MPTSPTTESGVFSLMPLSDITTAALRIAESATVDVPIIGQILSSVVHIVELAESLEKSNEVLRTLADTSATLTQQIDMVISGRAVEGPLLKGLEHLQSVLVKIEAFLSKQLAGSRARKVYRHLFVIPKQTEQLSQELETAIRAFLVTAVIDASLRIKEHSQYDGRFRHLRDCDVRALGTIAKHKIKDTIVTYAKARVDGEVMVVKYCKTRNASGEYTETDPYEADPVKDVLATISTIAKSHPNLVQIYGRGVGDASTRFTVFRSGVHPAADYLRATCGADQDLLTSRVWDMFHLVLVSASPVFVHIALTWYCTRDASRHLRSEVGAVWLPRSLSHLAIVVDDHGQPTIGGLDDIAKADAVSSRDYTASIVRALDEFRLSFLVDRTDVTEFGLPELCDGGKLQDFMAAVYLPPDVDNIWRTLRKEQLRVAISSVKRSYPRALNRSNVSPTTRRQADGYWDDVKAMRHETTTARMTARSDLALSMEPHDKNVLFSSDVRCYYTSKTTQSNGYISVFVNYWERDSLHTQDYHIFLSEPLESAVRDIVGMSKEENGFCPLWPGVVRPV